MKYDMISVLIADDEKIVREGLRNIIDWEALGFSICDEASTGTQTLEMIHLYNPGLVLLDIKMPGMNGTDLIEKARNEGFAGYFIIISGYSDFSYAQKVIQYGASCYLTKPVDEDELEKAVTSVHDKIKLESDSRTLKNQYLGKARVTVVHDLLTEAAVNPAINYPELGLSAPIYRVVIYEKYDPYFSSYSFADLLRITNKDNNSFEQSMVDNNNVILLKGSFALKKLDECLSHYIDGTQKGSPLDTMFIACGPIVSSLSDVHRSYVIAAQLIRQRFFCIQDQHFLTPDDLLTREVPGSIPSAADNLQTDSPSGHSVSAITQSVSGSGHSYSAITQSVSGSGHSYSAITQSDSLSGHSYSDDHLSGETSLVFGSRLADCIKAGSSSKVRDELNELKEYLSKTDDDVSDIKTCLAGIFLQVKQTVMKAYPEKEIPFVHNSAILELIENKRYLYEIMQYFTEQFDMIIRSVGNSTSDNILDKVTDYIDHNYQMPLRLEQIAELFGYSSSYLGKQFTAKTGLNFNTYLDKIRIDHAVDLLDNTNMKIYEIATCVGYRNVDYFHQKFKKFMNTSPAEYRKKGDS